MEPSELGYAYDEIVSIWDSESFDRLNGITQHERAISFVKNRGQALDVGCGCTGRFIELLLNNNFCPEGIDISAKMIKVARKRHPQITFYQQDICCWDIPQKYDFITAWDSIWHIPLNQQESVLTKLVSSLNLDGILIFSFGGTDKEGDHTDNFMGPKVYYSTLGINGFLKLFISLGCICRHLEYSNYPQELHAYMIIQKT
jgi:SAM-dependent methyltransferase